MGSVSGELSCLGVDLRPKGRTAPRRSLSRAGPPPGRPSFGAWSRSSARPEDSTGTTCSGIQLAAPARGRRRRRGQRDRRLGRRDAEAEALDEVQLDVLGVVAVIADRDVLAALEEKVPAAQAEYDAAVDAGRPHERPVED